MDSLIKMFVVIDQLGFVTINITRLSFVLLDVDIKLLPVRDFVKSWDGRDPGVDSHVSF